MLTGGSRGPPVNKTTFQCCAFIGVGFIIAGLIDMELIDMELAVGIIVARLFYPIVPLLCKSRQVGKNAQS
jgi:hypothetical protein